VRASSVSLLVILALVLGGGERSGAKSLSAAAPPLPEARPGPLRVDTLVFGRFGRVVVYRRSEHPSHVVLFVSGDGGWNLGVVRMAEELAGMDAAVAGIDIRRYAAALDRSTESCSYPAADFEALSQWLQRRLGYPAYTAPVLVGYSSGATLVYAVLVQAPPGTFRASVSLGFCPDLPLRRPLCRGSGLAWVPGLRGRGLSFLPADSTGAPWIALQGEADSTCFACQTTGFVRRVRGAEIVLLPKVGHGFGVESRWVPQFREAFARITSAGTTSEAPSDTAVRGLPLVELRSQAGGAELAIIVSGDGGWASLDRQIGETFAAQGISVVGLDALRYFWKARRPEEMGADLERIARHYLESWGARELLLVGYSRGAETLPFMVSRLPADLRDRIRIVALLGPSRTTAFEFHVADWLGGGDGAEQEATEPELEKLRGLRVLCVYGTGEKDSVCPSLPAGVATVMPVEGGHHFEGAYRDLAARILQAAHGN
jgi:type IV secretory pathway VirJ component